MGAQALQRLTPMTRRVERTPLKRSWLWKTNTSSTIRVQKMKTKPAAMRRLQMASFIFLRKKSIIVAMRILAATATKLITMPRVEAKVSETLWLRSGEVRLITIELCHICTKPWGSYIWKGLFNESYLRYGISQHYKPSVFVLQKIPDEWNVLEKSERTYLNPLVKDKRSCVAELLGGVGGSLWQNRKVGKCKSKYLDSFQQRLDTLESRQ